MGAAFGSGSAGSVFGSHVNDSAFWMFRTGRLRRHGEQRSWLTRIHFDPDSRGTLALWVEDRKVLRALPGGPRMLALWDGLWEG